MNSNCVIRHSLLVLSLVVFTGTAHAQFRGSLRGTVTDPTGAAVVGATVTLLDTDTNQKLVSVTDANGIYQFNALPPAPYKLTVEKAGFTTKVLDHVQIIPEQPNSLDIALEIGQVTQTITVSGTTEALDTETANINGTVTKKDVQNLPSFGRDVFQLVQLAPGVFGDGAQGGGGAAQNLPGTQGPGGTGGNQGIFQTENGPQAVAAGQQYETNSYSIDGISTASAVWGGTTIITPSEDSIQSVKIVSNAYDAEYGRFSGAQVQVTSASGTNNFHGDAFLTLHRPALNAFQPFGPQNTRPVQDSFFFDQFGGNFGGPIWKNRIFFFFTYESVRSPQSQPTISNGWYDTPAFDALAPAGSIAATYLSFPGSGVVSRGVNPVTCANAGLMEGVNCVTIPGQGLNLGSPLTTPLGTQDPGWTGPSNPGVGSGLSNVADIENYVTASTSNYSKDQYSGRLDANITANDHISYAMYWVPQSTSFLNGPAREYNFFHHSQINEAESAIWNHVFSPNLLNEFRVNAAGWHWNEISDNPQSPVGLPTDTIGQIGSLTGGTAISQFGPNVGSILDQWTYGWKDVATKVAGRHTIKFGGDLTRLFYLQDCAACGVPSYSFFNLWDFLNDAPHTEGSGFNGFNPATGAPTTERQDDRENIWGLFVQDDFKLRRNLTLNIGLRYNYFGSLSSKQGNMFAAVPGSGANFLTGLDVRLGHSWNPEKDNLGPEVGFAWSPAILHDRLVVRGGYGLNYNQEEIALSANIFANPGLVVFPTFVISTPSSPNPGIVYAVSSNLHSLNNYPPNPNAITPLGSNGLPATATNVQIFPRDFPTMRVHHYSLEVQYEIGRWIASVGYQGTLSRNILFNANPNAAPAALGFTLNPQIGGGNNWETNGWGNYNAMLAELKHQFARQFTLDAQFAWAKSMDTSSGPFFEQPYPYDLNLDYGRSDYNVSKAFKLFGVWQPVFFHGDRAWIEKIAGGWSLSGILNVHSGFPWSPVVNFGGSLYCGTCGYSTLFPAAYLAHPGTSTSNYAFKSGANYPNGAEAYFAIPTFTPFSGTAFGSTLPQAPGVRRNSLNGPNYRDLDVTVVKAFGLPRIPGLGENTKIEFRMDVYNLFNNLNFDPLSISNTIGCIAGPGCPAAPGQPGISNPIFGEATSVLAARVVNVGARFSF